MNRKFWGSIFILANLWIYPHIIFAEQGSLVKLLKINTKWEEKSKKTYKYNYIISFGRLSCEHS